MDRQTKVTRLPPMLTQSVNNSGFWWSTRWQGGSGIRWIIWKSLPPHFRQITTPISHHSNFLQAKFLSLCLSNSVKALDATKSYILQWVVMLHGYI